MAPCPLRALATEPCSVSLRDQAKAAPKTTGNSSHTPDTHKIERSEKSIEQKKTGQGAHRRLRSEIFTAKLLRPIETP